MLIMNIQLCIMPISCFRVPNDGLLMSIRSMMGMPSFVPRSSEIAYAEVGCHNKHMSRFRIRGLLNVVTGWEMLTTQHKRRDQAYSETAARCCATYGISISDCWQFSTTSTPTTVSWGVQKRSRHSACAYIKNQPALSGQDS